MTAPPAGVYERVRQNVVEDSPQTKWVRRNLWKVRIEACIQGNALRLRLSLDSSQRLRDHQGDVDGLEVEPELSGFDASEIEKFVDRFGQLLDTDERRGNELPLPAGEQIGSLLQHQQRHPERRQRGLELVRSHGDQLRTHFVEVNEIGDVIQQKDSASLVRIRVRNRNHARQQPSHGTVLFDANGAGEVARRNGVPSRGDGSPHGIEVQPLDSEIVETPWLVHVCRTERLHSRPVDRLDVPGRVEQHDCIRQGLERCFQRVLGPHDLANIRTAELGQIFGHLIECARQFAEFVSTFDLDALREPSFAQGIGASRQTSVLGPRRCA